MNKPTRYCESCRSALSESSPSHHYLCRQCFGKKFRYRRNRRKVVTEPSVTFANYGREKTSRTAGQCKNCLSELGENYVRRGFKHCYPCWRRKVINDSRMAVKRAIEERGAIRIKYWSRSSGTSIRDIDPEKIYRGHNGAEYFDGFCHSRGSMRTFRIDRIGELLEPPVRSGAPPDKSSNGATDASVRRGLEVSADPPRIIQSRIQSTQSSSFGIEHFIAILAAGLVITVLLL